MFFLHHQVQVLYYTSKNISRLYAYKQTIQFFHLLFSKLWLLRRMYLVATPEVVGDYITELVETKA